MTYRATALDSIGRPPLPVPSCAHETSEDVDDLKAAKRLPHYHPTGSSLFEEDFAPYLAELVGTFLLTMTFLCNYSDTSDVVWSVTSNALMNLVIAYSLAHVSGANCNPSVTIALTLAGRHTCRVACKLCFVQVLGASLAAALRCTFSNVNVSIGPRDGYGWYEADVIEVAYAAMLCLVFLSCSASLRNNPVGDGNGFFGLAIGFCFIAGGYAGRAVSPTIMNSAIAIGIGIVDSQDGVSTRGMHYLMCDLAGGFLGAGLYRLVRPEEFSIAEFFTKCSGMHSQEKVGPKILAEFIGTFYVIFTKALNRMSAEKDEGPEAWAVMAALAAMVYSLRDVSGAYFNPAVVVAVAASFRGFLSFSEVVWNIAVQVLSGFIATASVAILSHGMELKIKFNHIYSPAAVAFAEGFFTFLTCYVVLSTSTIMPVGSKTKRNNIAGLAYGACHTVGGFAIGNISGSMLNPAVLLSFGGIGVIHFELGDPFIHYLVWQFGGALLAAPAFFLTHPGAYFGDDPGSVETCLEGPTREVTLAC